MWRLAKAMPRRRGGRVGPAGRLGGQGGEAVSDVQYDRFDDLTEQDEANIREPGPRWSPRASAIFLAVSSLGLWALIALALKFLG
jgi:hypothetical protein